MRAVTAATGGGFHRISAMSGFENGLLDVVAGHAQRHFFFLEQIGLIRTVRKMAGGARVCLQGFVHHFLLKCLLGMALVAQITAGSF